MDMRRVCSAHSAPGGFVLDKQAVPKGSSGFSIHFHDQCAMRIMGIARDVPSGHCCRAQLWAVSAAPAHREPPGTLETPAGGGGGGRVEREAVWGMVDALHCAMKQRSFWGDGRIVVHVDRLGLGSLILTRGYVFMDFLKNPHSKIPFSLIFRKSEREGEREEKKQKHKTLT